MLIDSNKDITNGTEVDEIRTYRYLFNKSLASCAVVTKPFTRPSLFQVRNLLIIQNPVLQIEDIIFPFKTR